MKRFYSILSVAILVWTPFLSAKAAVEKDNLWISPSYTRSYPLVAKRGRGALVPDRAK